MSQTPLTDAILPCPFCGAQPVLSYSQTCDENWIACENESCEVAPSVAAPGIKQVTARWNKRP